MKSQQINQVYFYLLFIVSFICLTSASIYYEKPSSARLAAASQKPPACTYQNQKYQHGQQVPTPEPCLNCTCRKGVLLCFLRVCPTLIQSNPSDNCITVREPGQCCPTLKCEIISQNDISMTTPNIATTKSLLEFSKSFNNQNLSTERADPSNGLSLTTEANPNPNSNSIYYFSDFKNLKPAEKSIETRNDGKVSVTQRDRTTTIFQTSPSTTFHESLLVVTSSPASNFEDSEDDIIANAEGSCQLNGTLYAEGSAVISTSFCEYCYCIRSKRMCIRPRCHLSILGCMPRYTSEYACCPTSYVCGDEALTTLPMTTTTTTTTTTSTTTAESVRLMGRKAACLINGIEYKVGEPIASDEHCKQCYCSTGGIKKCKKIQCSPEMEGCIPLIPEGHCCPVEYKCNSTLETTESAVEMSSNTNSDLNPTITQQNINDMTDIGITINPNDGIVSDITTETQSNDNLLIDHKINIKSSNSDQTNLSSIYEFRTDSDSETNNPLQSSDSNDMETKTESILVQTENTINGQQMRSDDMIFKNDDLIPYLSTESNIENKRTEDSIDSIIETITVKSNYPSNDYIKSDIKPDLYSENQTIITNDIEITTQNIVSVGTDYLLPNNGSNLTSEANMNGIQNFSIEINDNFVNSVQNISNESLMKTIVTNEDNETQVIQNETALDSVGVILHGIIHAIDKQLQRRIPAEPRLKNNSSDEISDSKQMNDSKPMTYRSENKAGPSLSSSFFITDDNEPPYKSDSDGVEIITAKTAFYDLYENPGDSILINLTPSSLKVSASPFNHQPSNPSNDKKFDILGQNNRAAIYGRPANPFPQSYLQPKNDWKIVNSNFPRKPQFESTPSPSKPIESLYYNQNTQRQDSDEILDKNNTDFDKRPRLELDNPMDINNRMKVIPFKVNDAVAGLSHKRKNGSFLIRVSTPNKNALTPDLTSKSNQQISCFFNNMEYPNGAMIPKSDPCTLCRCFYGRELCQQQKCPAPPEKDCVPEKMNGYCCPRYICRVIEDPKISANSHPIDSLVHLNSDSLNSSPIRKSPQFSTENKNNFNTNNLVNESNNEMAFPGILPQNQENNFEDKIISEEIRSPIQLVADSVTPPNRLNSQSSGSSPKPFHKISGMNSKIKPNENRIHFPIDKEIDSVISQPVISDPISPYSQTNSRPSKPIISGSHNSQYNNANKFRLKPSPTLTQSSASQSPFGNPQKPNGLRLPPFLLHTHSGTNSPQSNRHKPNIPSTFYSDEISNKSETLNNNSTSETNSENTSTVNSIDFSKHVKPDPSQALNLLTPKYHSTTSLPDVNHSTSLPTVSIMRTTSTPAFILSSMSSTAITASTASKSTAVPNDANKSGNGNPWDLFRVSGCNIYGTMYEINTKIERLSTVCKNCICSVQGVKCTDIC